MPDELDGIDIQRAPGAPTGRVKTGGRTSVEAATEYLDAMDEQAKLLDMDALERAALRRAMGFDFQVSFAPSKIFISAVGFKKLRVHIKLQPGDLDDEGNVIPDKVNKRLADACIRLKAKYDAKEKR